MWKIIVLLQSEQCVVYFDFWDHVSWSKNVSCQLYQDPVSYSKAMSQSREMTVCLELQHLVSVVIWTNLFNVFYLHSMKIFRLTLHTTQFICCWDISVFFLKRPKTHDQKLIRWPTVMVKHFETAYETRDVKFDFFTIRNLFWNILILFEIRFHAAVHCYM